MLTGLWGLPKHRRWGISPRPEDNCSLESIITLKMILSISVRFIDFYVVM